MSSRRGTRATSAHARRPRPPKHRSDPSPYYFDRAAAAHVCEFFPRYLTFTKGEWTGQPFTLQPWQTKILSTAFGWKRKADGLRRYRIVYVFIPKKNGKSEVAAGVALYLLTSDNEPGAMIYSVAADKDQAAAVFEPAKLMVESSPALKARCEVYTEEIYFPDRNSYYRVLSADVKSKHGLNAHGIVFDELHAQESRLMWDTLRGARIARRQPMIFACTTAGVDMKTICGEIHTKATQIRKGTAQDDTFLPVLFGAGEKDDWEDRAVWKKANPNFGISVKADALEEEYTEAKRSPAFQNTFKRMHLNLWVRQVHRWIDLKRWEACAGPVSWDDMLQAMKGRACYGGLDLATVTDLASLQLVFESCIVPGDDDYPTEKEVDAGDDLPQIPGWEYGDPLPYYDVLSRFWCPEEGVMQRAMKDRVEYDVWRDQGALIATPGDAIDYSLIRKELNDLGREVHIQELAVDPWNAHQLSTELEEEDGFTIVRVSQNFGSMSAPTKALDAFYRRRQLRHGGHPVLTWNADNAALDVDAYDNWKPSKKRSRERIDGIVALVMALGRAMVSTGTVEDARPEPL
jgi:phage terminase large subunit-like protein